MTATSHDTLFYDPSDPEVSRNPYPIFERMREEAPLYHHPDQDFYAVSRFADVEGVLKDRDTYISRKGVTLQILRSGMEFPGTLIFEDQPTHSIHRTLLSRMFTNRRVSGLEQEIRDLCAEIMDPLVGSGGFDLVAEIAAEVPMRVIGMLVGIPEEDQIAFRERVHTARDNPAMSLEESMSGSPFGPYLDWRADHPSDDIMSHLLNAEFEDEHGEMTKLTRDELLAYTNIVAVGRQRDHQRAHRLRRATALRQPRRATQAGGGSVAHPQRGRGGVALRAQHAAQLPLRRP